VQFLAAFFDRLAAGMILRSVENHALVGARASGEGGIW
jgi:hypothetical protein